jgi:hypothetical protein
MFHAMSSQGNALVCLAQEAERAAKETTEGGAEGSPTDDPFNMNISGQFARCFGLGVEGMPFPDVGVLWRQEKPGLRPDATVSPKGSSNAAQKDPSLSVTESVTVWITVRFGWYMVKHPKEAWRRAQCSILVQLSAEEADQLFNNLKIGAEIPNLFATRRARTTFGSTWLLGALTSPTCNPTGKHHTLTAFFLSRTWGAELLARLAGAPASWVDLRWFPCTIPRVAGATAWRPF